MIITWLGEAGIRLQTKDATLMIDPPGADTGFKAVRSAADIIALTQKDGRDYKSVTGEPFLIEGPGEYERKNIFVYGIDIAPGSGQTHFRLSAEDITFAHLADLPRPLEDEQVGKFEGVDVLFVPVGGKSVLTAEQAAALVSQIEPRVVIPIQYHTPGSTSGFGKVDAFLKAIGAKSTETLDKWKILKKDLPTDETSVIVLQAS